MLNKGAQGVGDGLTGCLIMPGQVPGGLDDVLGLGLDSLPPVTASTQRGDGCRHAVPVYGLLDIEPALESSHDGLGVVGELPGLRILGVADDSEGFFG